jgi:hypothetical protein
MMHIYGLNRSVLFGDDLRFVGGCGKLYTVRVLGAVATGAVTVAALVIAAQGAQASTPGCTGGAYAGYCGVQANNASTDLVMDSAGQGTGTNNKVIGWPNSTADPGTDWVQLPYGGNPANGVMWIFAPNGIPSNMCAADPGDNLVVLRTCNGSNWQRWDATSVPGQAGFQTWTNRATHKILQSGVKGAQLITVSPPSTPSGNQQWRFVA